MNTKNNVPELIRGDDRLKWMVHSNNNIKCFTRGEIETLTNNFRTLIGRGGFGEVFQGFLEDDSTVAVKRFIHNVKENFAKELTVHSAINHKNVVRLIGYCAEENALMMVTEYIPKGNLSDVLHQDSSHHIPLDIRLRIATECAEALAYMHSYMYTQVIHGDVKPANILLDGNFNAKLSDFGISRLVNTDTTLYTDNFKGSIGYMDPLFGRDGRLTTKSDVYSFGVVLLELITLRTQDGKASISDLCTDALSRGFRGLREMFDPEVVNQSNMKILKGVAKLACECLRMERGRRPQMIDVVVRLGLLRDALNQAQQRPYFFFWARKSKPSPLPLPTTSLPSAPAPAPAPAPCHQFTFAEIEAATKNFDVSLLVGEGYSGKVYCGYVNGGSTKVAIKRLRHAHAGRYRSQFWIETRMRSKVCHSNLVPLIGYCDEKDEFIVVYDYMSRGSLHDHLYCQDHPPLSWKHRLDICIGAARGLHYLHQGVKPAIIHYAVNLTNILLDDEWVAKISHNVESDRYTTSKNGGLITEKTGVYCFGTVLFEVLCARPFVELVYLLHWSAFCNAEGNLDEVVDPYLKGKINPQCLNKFFETAKKCLAYEAVDRPSMGDVLLDLEHALRLQEAAEASENLC